MWIDPVHPSQATSVLQLPNGAEQLRQFGISLSHVNRQKKKKNGSQKNVRDKQSEPRLVN